MPIREELQVHKKARVKADRGIMAKCLYLARDIIKLALPMNMH